MAAENKEKVYSWMYCNHTSKILTYIILGKSPLAPISHKYMLTGKTHRQAYSILKLPTPFKPNCAHPWYWKDLLISAAYFLVQTNSNKTHLISSNKTAIGTQIIQFILEEKRK